MYMSLRLWSSTLFLLIFFLVKSLPLGGFVYTGSVDVAQRREQVIPTFLWQISRVYSSTALWKTKFKVSVGKWWWTWASTWWRSSSVRGDATLLLRVGLALRDGDEDKAVYSLARWQISKVASCMSFFFSALGDKKKQFVTVFYLNGVFSDIL